MVNVLLCWVMYVINVFTGSLNHSAFYLTFSHITKNWSNHVIFLDSVSNFCLGWLTPCFMNPGGSMSHSQYLSWAESTQFLVLTAISLRSILIFLPSTPRPSYRFLSCRYIFKILKELLPGNDLKLIFIINCLLYCYYYYLTVRVAV